MPKTKTHDPAYMERLTATARAFLETRKRQQERISAIFFQLKDAYGEPELDWTTFTQLHTLAEEEAYELGVASMTGQAPPPET